MTGRPHYLDPDIRWLTPAKLPLRLGMFLAALVLFTPLFMAMTLPRVLGGGSECMDFIVQLLTWGILGAGLLVAGPVVAGLRRMARTRVGVINEWVLVDHGNGTIRTARDEDLLRLPKGFIIDHTTIPTGTPQFALYDKKELRAWLQPRLERATPLSPAQQILWQWRHNQRLFVVAALGLLAMIVLLALVEQDSVKGQAEQWLRSRPECQSEFAPDHGAP